MKTLQQIDIGGDPRNALTAEFIAKQLERLTLCDHITSV